MRIKVIEHFDILFSVLLLFFILWYCEDDVVQALIKTFFLVGMFLFNFIVIYSYVAFKEKKWKWSLVSKEYNWKFAIGGIACVIVIFPIVMPKIFLVRWIVCSVVLWVVLLVYDIIKNGWHSH